MQSTKIGYVHLLMPSYDFLLCEFHIFLILFIVSSSRLINLWSAALPFYVIYVTVVDVHYDLNHFLHMK
jgi:hypothetical protein